jgi:hypothetical protein
VENLKDQLARLFPNLGGEERKADRRRVETVHTAKVAPSIDEGDWKKGVTPLAPSDRSALDHHRLERKPRLRPTKPAPLASKHAPRRPASIPQAKAPTQKITKQAARPIVAGAGDGPTARVGRLEPAPHFGSLRPPALTREGEYKDADAWVYRGSLRQVPGGGKGPVLPVRMGIDFGTAYTKVALRIADRVFFVSWNGIRKGNYPYFLPGEVALLGDGSVCLGRAPKAEEVRCDLKLPFLVRHLRSREQFAAALAFLAHVMRYARAWLYETHASLLHGRQLAWVVNLGCPTNSWAAQDLKFSYETLGYFAWQLSQTPGSIAWSDAMALPNAARPTLESIGLDDIKLVPEFVAQIAGYVRSPQRRDGLHLLMDVGAGSLDVATFNVFFDKKNEEDRYPIFASEVLPLGTHFLMAKRYRDLDLSDTSWDDFAMVPSASDYASQAQVDPQKVTEIDAVFSSEVSRAVQKLLDYTHTRRYGKASEWRNGLPAFLSGGGAECDIYSSGLAAAFRRHGVSLKRTPFPLLEEASRSEGISEKIFHRLSVAYGLTFDAESIGRILAPHEIEDAPRFDPVVDKPRERPDRDELYPK